MVEPVKFSSISPERVFFKSEGSFFVLDEKDKRMFLIDEDKLFEISSVPMKLKITLESSVIPERKALKSAFKAPFRPRAKDTASS